jgi:stage II sporulation protein D
MQRTTNTFLAVLLSVLTICDAAQGAPRFVIRGAGFGHGVGMSQYGADGYAQHGKGYRFILAHYFTGTSLEQLSTSPTVRVLLQVGSSASFGHASSASGRRLDPDTVYTAAPVGLGRIELRGPSGNTLASFASPLRVTGDVPIRLHGRAQNGLSDGYYRGAMEFRATAVGSLESINAVGLEDYVRGVVGAESPPSWPAAALEAQAVAARTYAITTAASGDYEQYADTRSQMYRGTAAEVASTEAAVSATRNQVVTYHGKPVVTYFFSTSGGRTEDVENSFIGSPAHAWLRSVADPYDNVSPLHRWGPISMSMAAAARRLGGLVKGRFKGIVVTKRGASPRVVYAQVVGTGGRVRVTGPQLRSAFGLHDTWATFKVVTASGQTKNTSGPTGSDTTGTGTGTGAGGDPGGVSPPGG